MGDDRGDVAFPDGPEAVESAEYGSNRETAMTVPCLAPKADLAPPRFEMPAGATDTHSHVIGLPPEYPFVPERSYTPPETPLAAYKAMHRALGIERAVIVTPSVHGTNNRITVESIAGYGPQARGIAVVDPGISDIELNELLYGGIRGIRLNVLFGGGVGLQAFEALAPRIRPLGWHIQLLLDVSRDMVAMAPIIRAGGIPVVVDHMGHMPVEKGLDDPGFRMLLELARNGLAWAKLSGNYRISTRRPHFEDAIPFAQALIDACPQNMVWGTDWPHVAMTEEMPDTTDLLNALDDYAPDPAMKRRILVENPAALYGFT